MRNKIKTLKGALLCAALFAGLALPATAGTIIGVNSGGVINSSGAQYTNQLATNGIYPGSIATTTTVTNLVALTSGNSGNVVSLQLNAQATGADTTNVVFQLSYSVVPLVITNSTVNGQNNASGPRTLIPAVTLALAGTAMETTNITFTTETTPPWNGKLNLYMESIAMGAVPGGICLTNYSVYVVAN